MVESYEDINMRAMHSGENVGFIINYVYHYVPRIGEFYQQIAAKFMTNTVSFGPDLLFRLVTALIAWLSIYFTTVFTIGHKISMKYKDVLVYLLCSYQLVKHILIVFRLLIITLLVFLLRWHSSVSTELILRK